MSNLRNAAVSETAVFELLDANDEPMIGDDGKPQSVELYGPGSRKYVKARSDQSNRFVKLLKSNKNKKELSAEEAQEEHARFLADCTKGFSENVQYIPKGAEASLAGDEMHVAIYMDPEIGFISDFVNGKLGKWGNFTKASTKS